VQRRKAAHVRALKKNTHYNSLLQAAWNKQRGKGFKFKVVRECASREDAYKTEQRLISKALIENTCYNILNGGLGGDSNTYHPDYDLICEKKRISGRAAMAAMSDEERRKKFSKPGHLNPNFKGWSSISFCNCGNQKALSAKTCKECYDMTGKGNPFYGRKHSNKTIQKLRKANRGKLPVNTNRIEIDGVAYKSQAEAARQLGVSGGTITHRLKSSNPKYENYRVLNA
jgi:group I intron endonuclease